MIARKAVAQGAPIIGLLGCSPTLPPAAFDGRTPVMRPQVLFAGKTESSGVLESRSGTPIQRFRVEGNGRMTAGGDLDLDQHIFFEGSAATSRTWMLRKIDQHHFVGTLSDASGPVRGEAYGNLFHLVYPMKYPSIGWMEQWLYLQPDGRTVINEATVSVFGVTVARLSERITHQTER